MSVYINLMPRCATYSTEIRCNGTQRRVIATSDIPANKVILTENAVFGYREENITAESLLSDVNELPELVKLLKTTKLYPCTYKDVRRGFEFMYRNSDRRSLNIFLKRDIMEELEHLCVLWSFYNNFTVGDYKFVTLMSSAINHSCSPNSRVYLAENYIRVVATRDIKVDEEITISYTDPIDHLSQCKRKLLLKNKWNFVCECSTCKSCSVCGSKDNLKRCSKCKLVLYCSTDCQKKDWKTHLELCMG